MLAAESLKLKKYIPLGKKKNGATHQSNSNGTHRKFGWMSHKLALISNQDVRVTYLAILMHVCRIWNKKYYQITIIYKRCLAHHGKNTDIKRNYRLLKMYTLKQTIILSNIAKFNVI